MTIATELKKIENFLERYVEKSRNISSVPNLSVLSSSLTPYVNSSLLTTNKSVPLFVFENMSGRI